MNIKLKCDTDKLEQALRDTPDTVLKELAETLDDIKDEWVNESVNVAPKDTGNLRRQIHGEVKANKNNTTVTVRANAMDDGFNYGWYIHEVHVFGRQFSTPGTIEKFLEEPANDNLAKWEKDIENAIERALKKEGW